MPAAPKARQAPAPSTFLTAFEEVSEAVESGAGLPAVARAAAHALDASVAVSDSASRVLAVSCQSPEDERAVLAGEGATETMDLRVADERVGVLRVRPRGTPPEAALLRIVTTLIAQEVDRAGAPERASEAAVTELPVRPALAQGHRPREHPRPCWRSWAAICRAAPRSSWRGPVPWARRRVTGARVCWPLRGAERGASSARRWPARWRSAPAARSAPSS